FNGVNVCVPQLVQLDDDLAPVGGTAPEPVYQNDCRPFGHGGFLPDLAVCSEKSADGHSSSSAGRVGCATFGLSRECVMLNAIGPDQPALRRAVELESVVSGLDWPDRRWILVLCCADVKYDELRIETCVVAVDFY